MLSEENIAKKQSVLHMHNYLGNKLQEKKIKIRIITNIFVIQNFCNTKFFSLGEKNDR